MERVLAAPPAQDSRSSKGGMLNAGVGYGEGLLFPFGNSKYLMERTWS